MSQPFYLIDSVSTREHESRTRLTTSHRFIRRQLAAKCSLGLGVDALTLTIIPRREVEDLEVLDAGEPAERPGLPGGEMVALQRLVTVLIEKERLAEEHVGMARQLDDLRDVRPAEQRIDDVRQPLPRGLDDEAIAQLAEAELRGALASLGMPARHDPGVVGLLPANGGLQLVEPRPRRDAQALERVTGEPRETLVVSAYVEGGEEARAAWNELGVLTLHANELASMGRFDEAAEPARAALVPHLGAVLAIDDPDVLGAYLSGAGPSVAVLARRDFGRVERLLALACEAAGSPVTVRTLAVHQYSDREENGVMRDAVASVPGRSA